MAQNTCTFIIKIFKIEKNTNRRKQNFLIFIFQSTENKSLFFARKFDPTVNQQIINNVEEWLYGHYTDGGYGKSLIFSIFSYKLIRKIFYVTDFDSKKRYWQNIYHHADRSPPPDDAMISVCSSLSRHALQAISGDNFMCSKLEFRKLLQVHSYYDDDVHKVSSGDFRIFNLKSQFWRSKTTANKIFQYQEDF